MDAYNVLDFIERLQDEMLAGEWKFYILFSVAGVTQTVERMENKMKWVIVGKCRCGGNMEVFDNGKGVHIERCTGVCAAYFDLSEFDEVEAMPRKMKLREEN